MRTARRLASTRSVVQGGGDLYPGLGGVQGPLSWPVVTLSFLGGTPIMARGVPQAGPGTAPMTGHGDRYPRDRTRNQRPGGIPSAVCEQTHTFKNVTFPHLSDTGGKNCN